ncbi:MAG: DNA polymerase Y family protein [Rhodoferax sp.]|nr:DNA polymerase Y family protein [Rhodoferax sp.]HQX59238.1 DNA polymerase Y family protein [Burkholderiaceae bacterium]
MHWIALQPLHERAPPDATATAPDAAGRADGIDPSLPDPPVTAGDLQALGWWALRFTPRVALQESAGALLLEVSASERLFGGHRQLITQLLAPGCPLAHIRVARAPTALLALARLQVDLAAERDPDQLPLHTLADARPHLATLERLGCRVWGDLRALPRGGVVRRFGAPLLDALDRAYGQRPEVYPWLVLPEVFDMPLELLAQVETAPALLFAARRLLGALQVWLQARHCGILALELCWQMDARRDTATGGSLVVRTAMPTLDMVHLQRLLAENLARITLPAPVLTLRLRSIETAALSGASASLLPDEQTDGDDLIQLLERLSARLGPQRVLRMSPRGDHRPECMQEWTPAEGVASAIRSAAGDPVPGRGIRAPAQAARGDNNKKKDSSRGGNGSGSAANAGVSGAQRRTAAIVSPAASDALYPTWLLVTPLRLAVRQDRPLYQGPLTLLAGPQRLEAAWWDVSHPVIADTIPRGTAAPDTGHAPARPEPEPAVARPSDAPPSSRLALRDYFLARSEQAGLLWIYRERLMAGRLQSGKPQGHWYLHGVFG